MKNYKISTLLIFIFFSCKPEPEFIAHHAYWQIKNNSNTELRYITYQYGNITKDKVLGTGTKDEIFMYKIDDERIILFSDITDIVDSIGIYHDDKYITLKDEKHARVDFFNESNWQFEKTIRDTYEKNEMYSYIWTFTINNSDL